MEKNLESLNPSQVKELLAKTLSSWIAERDRLNELDRALGDGDHGSTISRGAQAAIDSLQTGNFSSVNQVFAAVGRAMMTSMGGASGMLFGLFFRSAEKISVSEVLDLGTLNALFDRGLEDLQARTKAQPGDKTMFDALIPALTSLRKSQGDLIAALDQAASSATEGAQKSAELIPKFGRAKTLGERARGTADPGATSVAIFFTGLAANAKTLSPQS
ncbi:MAG TPA: dihydroxyacetone kinase subunit DhaL [Chthoniobacterales bacterium]|jgi:dihydroxyacetone kinase-like protein